MIARSGLVAENWISFAYQSLKIDGRPSRQHMDRLQAFCVIELLLFGNGKSHIVGQSP